MRWLILLLIVSCGKHQEPKALDLRDNDGDQIVNAQESGNDKYIANVETIGNLKGKMLIPHNELVEVNFKNQPVIAAEIITSSEKKLVETKYFSEGSKVLLENTPKLDFKSVFYKVSLQFHEVTSHPDEIYFSSGDRKFFLTDWKPFVTLEITSSDLKLIMEGKAHFVLAKKFVKKSAAFEANENETVEKNTYRVFFQDGDKNRVLYVSKDHAFEDLLEDLKISSSHEIKEDDLFFHSREISDRSWFYRHFKNGDKALIKTEFQTLVEIFNKRFTITKQLLTRENGQAVNSLKFDNRNAPQIYLRLRPKKTSRSFQSTQEERRYSEGGGGGREGNGRSWAYCTHYLTVFQNLAPVTPPLAEVIEELGMNSAEFMYQEQNDEKGNFLEVKATSSSEEIKLSFPNRPAASFRITGQNRARCDSGPNHVLSPPVSTNEEAKFSLEVESYVEKLN